ncbi:MAG TPA: phosphomannomutase/phosphoglucomutase [Alphaproteobacteria bacterium]|nr:phosphomannomutase/phosphoglucomutase [Alphaproteobacteria bacterium]
MAGEESAVGTGRNAIASARINPALRRSYDLRGVFGKTLTVDDAYGVGCAFAALAHDSSLSRIAVSRDGRLSSPALEAALVDGLRRGGMHVFRLPLGPTPLLSFTIHRLGLDGGIMVTGSHNPPDQNGFKLLLDGTEPVFGSALDMLWGIEPVERSGGRVEDTDISSEYLSALAAEVMAVTPVTITWDSGNGATGGIVERLEHRIPGKHFKLYTEIDGRFPNHHPDPAVAKNLSDLAATVVHSGSDLGIAFDGDGDRIGVVDSAGEIVWPDQLLLLLARDVLRERPGSTVVADVKSSGVLFDGIAAAGGRALMGPSGYVLVRERMLQAAAPIAGEMSGHIFFGDRWHHADDGLYVAMRTIRALAHARMSLEEFRESLPPVFATPEIRLPCPDDRKAEVIEHIAQRLGGAKVDRTDGLRVTEEGGWWLLRASGTEAKLTARCEAQDAASLKQLKSSLGAALREAGLPADEFL